MFLFIFFVNTISYIFDGAILCALNCYSILSLCLHHSYLIERSAVNRALQLLTCTNTLHVGNFRLVYGCKTIIVFSNSITAHVHSYCPVLSAHFLPNLWCPHNTVKGAEIIINFLNVLLHNQVLRLGSYRLQVTEYGTLVE